MTKPVDLPVDGFCRYRIDFGYDGTDFSGFAKQPGLRTVQAELVKAIAVIFGKDDNDFKLRIAGRTDAGVHAQHQVAHLDLTPNQLKRIGRNPDIAGRVNTALPKDIRVFSFDVAPEGFDARYSATFRKYRYRVADKNCFVDPLDIRYVLEVKPELDLKLMKQAAKVLIGLHDFGGFCKPRAGATTIRRLRSINIARNQSKGRIIEIELKGDAFCHNMVRSIVGALVAVGRGRASVLDVQKRLKSGSRAGSLKVVAAKGLSLIEVGYPKD
ncbi:MAG: tRNA pseudouridine(38-40) synthase TruA, partial [Actinobacteria bacterium]|nr:tRNA pseudouridine(38-40) synthase TruA [Actinomycetota bacterium]